MHSLATNADQRIDMSVDHVGAIDNGNGRGARRHTSLTMSTQSDEEVSSPMLRTLPTPS